MRMTCDTHEGEDGRHMKKKLVLILQRTGKQRCRRLDKDALKWVVGKWLVKSWGGLNRRRIA